MRTYGRIPVDPLYPDGAKKWVVVETNKQGYNDAVYITALAQTCKLNLNESPFWANFGIPARESVMMQILPDFYIAFIQQYYSNFFASLTWAKRLVGDPNGREAPQPVYDFSVTTHQGFRLPPIRIKPVPI